MQVGLSEKILNRLAGSSSVNPVIASELSKLGAQRDVARELESLDLSRKIIRCKVTKGETSKELVFLSCQIVSNGRLYLENLPKERDKTKPASLRHCKGCNKDLLANNFARYRQQCIACDKPTKVKSITRYCLICKKHHPHSAFPGKSKMCIATKDRHAQYVADSKIAALKKFHGKKVD